MIGWNFNQPFVTRRDIQELGGMKHVAKNNYGRNMWRIMEKFQVLPTDERFQNLSPDQIEYIFANMEMDMKEQQRMAKGLKNTVEDDDDSWWNEDSETFDPLREDHDEDDLAKQVDALLTETERRKKAERIKADDYSEEEQEMIKQNHQDEIRDHINKRLEELDDEVNNGKTKEEKPSTTVPEDMTKDDLESAINLFNGTEEETDDFFDI